VGLKTKILSVVAGAIAAAMVAWLAVHRARPTAMPPIIEAPVIAAVPAPAPDVATVARPETGTGAPAGDDGEPAGVCTVALEGSSPVAVACREGGRRAAKKVMKELVKAAHKNGKRKTCDECHVDLETFTLLAGARRDLDSLVRAARR
jgi:hypothetical protein